MIYIDHHGNQRPLDEMRALFGPVPVREAPAGNAYRLAELRDSGPNAPAEITVTVLSQEGQPLPSVPVCWSWPDAPKDPYAGWDGRAVTAHTGPSGTISFAMGPGAKYAPPTPARTPSGSMAARSPATISAAWACWPAPIIATSTPPLFSPCPSPNRSPSPSPSPSRSPSPARPRTSPPPGGRPSSKGWTP